MFLLSLGVSYFPAVLPPLALALLTGLNSAAVGLIFFAAYQLACMTITDTATRLILFGTGAIASTYSAIWLFPVLTVAGGLITLARDWPGWSDVQAKVVAPFHKGKKQKRVEEIQVEEIRREDEDIAIEELGFDNGSAIGKEASESISKPSSMRIPTPPPEQHLDTTLRRRGNTPVVAPTPAIKLEEVAEMPMRTPINFHLTIWQSCLVVGAFFALLIAILVVAGTIPNPVRELKLFSNLLTAGTILFGGSSYSCPCFLTRSIELTASMELTPSTFFLIRRACGCSTFARLLRYTWVGYGSRFPLRIRHSPSLPRSKFQFLGLSRSFGVRTLPARTPTHLTAHSFPPSTNRLPSNPVLGAVLAFLGIFTPGIALKFAMLPAYTKFRENKYVRSVLRGLNAAASGLVWTAVYRTSLPPFASPSFNSLTR